MARSMTAFARHEASAEWGRAIWELRSVNHRYLEVGLRLPEDFRHLETGIRSRVSSHLNRGKIDCALRYDLVASEHYTLNVNVSLAKQIAHAAQEVTRFVADPASINPLDILRWPGVIETPELERNRISQWLLELLDKTLSELIDTRAREGAKLKEVLLERCDDIDQLVEKLRIQVPEIVANIRDRHQQKIAELATGLDEARVEQECALLLQKLDVAEELDRLATHVSEVRRVLAQPQAIGRRLDFLMQELNREANTLGSKSAHIDTAGASVDLKVLIEQMREQIQNLE